MDKLHKVFLVKELYHKAKLCMMFYQHCITVAKLRKCRMRHKK